MAELLIAASIDDADEVAEAVCEQVRADTDVFEALRAAARSGATAVEQGAFVLARLVHGDGEEEWHPAVVETAASCQDDEIELRFEGFGLVKRVPRAEVALGQDLADGDEEDGVCEICLQSTALTRHHMRFAARSRAAPALSPLTRASHSPRSEHARLLRLGFTSEQLLGAENVCLCCRRCAGRRATSSTRALTCARRRCHTMVHRFETNRSLAEEYFTGQTPPHTRPPLVPSSPPPAVERIRAHPRVRACASSLAASPSPHGLSRRRRRRVRQRPGDRDGGQALRQPLKAPASSARHPCSCP